MKTFPEALAHFQSQHEQKDATGGFGWLEKYNSIGDEIRSTEDVGILLADLLECSPAIRRIARRYLIALFTLMLRVMIIGVVIGMEMEKHEE